MTTNILIIEGTSPIGAKLERFLSSRFHTNKVSGEEAISGIIRYKPAVVLTDIVFPEVDGLALLEDIKSRFPSLKMIVVTQSQEIEAIIKAFKLGVMEYVWKGIDLEKLEQMINRASKIAILEKKFPDPIKGDYHIVKDNFVVGRSEAMLKILKIIGSISSSRVTVSIFGETGTGKELLARLIHENSPCKNEPFIAVDCTTLVESLSESILYGHSKGAFTGALESHRGKFEIAGNGTIFFDEVSELPLSIQGKLLRFLQEKEFEKVGGERRIKSNARIIAASNKRASEMVRQGKFRKDLYYRLKVVNIYIPPLRERKEDIPLLINHFIRKIKQIHDIPEIRMEERAYLLLLDYSWPGNVRELENLLTRIAIMNRGELILEETIRNLLEQSRQVEAINTPDSLYPSLAMTEKRTILRTLEYTNWNVSAAAKILMISRPTLRKKIQKYQLAP